MTKVAILIDGAFYLKRLLAVRKDIELYDVESVSKSIDELVYKHLSRLNDERFVKGVNHSENPYNLLHRCFYYDAEPFAGRTQKAISKKTIDYIKSEQAQFRRDLFEAIKRKNSFALRLGKIKLRRKWILREVVQEKLITKKKEVKDLEDDDFYPGFEQKGVDMRIGVDIAHITLKKQVDTIILVAGDADFVPAAKLARREGVKIILDSLWNNVPPDLYEHIDELHSCFSKPERKA